MGRTRRRISLILWMLFLCVMGAVSTVREIHGEFTALICIANCVGSAAPTFEYTDAVRLLVYTPSFGNVNGQWQYVTSEM